MNNLKQILKGAKAVNPQQLPELLQVFRSLPHGHVAVILNSIKQLQIDKTIDPEQSRQRNLILAMIVARIINPAMTYVEGNSCSLATYGYNRDRNIR